MTPLTEKQRAALVALRERARSPFDFGSTTVNRLCALGLAERIHHVHANGRASTTLHITPEGLDAIGAPAWSVPSMSVSSTSGVAVASSVPLAVMRKERTP